MQMSANPWADAERAQEKKKRKHRACSRCNRPLFLGDDDFYGDEAYYVEGVWICEDCISHYKMEVC